MTELEVCHLCGGQGFVFFYCLTVEAPEDDRTTRRCPNCGGAGTIEFWRQSTAGASKEEGWVSAAPYRLD